MNYTEAVRWLFSFTDYEFTPLAGAPAEALQLSRLRSLLARVGNPERCARTVHITGSKGKGSTASMVAALLRGSGVRTGLYTSPHLHSPCERIRIDGEPIGEAEFAAHATGLRTAAELENATRNDALTTFELLTALAFIAFRDNCCDWQVIEVGMGGRLDATNVLDEKAVCVFTPISLEHTAILGPTTAAIASDKAGILRRGTTAVLAPQYAEAEAVLRQACEDLEVPVAYAPEVCRWTSTPRGFDGQDCVVHTQNQEYRFFLPLLGRHQLENAAVALLSGEQLRTHGVTLPADQASATLGSVRWPGRLEVVCRAPAVLVDGAHNGASAARLAEALRDLAIEHGDASKASGIMLVIGTLADKDLAGMVKALSPIAGCVYAVEPDHPRARPAAGIAAAFGAAAVPVEYCGAVAEGVRRAIAAAPPGAIICVAGSLYVAAEARTELLSGAGTLH